MRFGAKLQLRFFPVGTGIFDPYRMPQNDTSCFSLAPFEVSWPRQETKAAAAKAPGPRDAERRLEATLYGARRHHNGGSLIGTWTEEQVFSAWPFVQGIIERSKLQGVRKRLQA